MKKKTQTSIMRNKSHGTEVMELKFRAEMRRIMRNNMLSESEMAFARIIWEREPVRSGELVKICNETFGWKKSTTYTVLKNLCKEGIFRNEDAVVTSEISKEEYLERESTNIVNNRFDGSISKFVTAFAGREKLSRSQIEELRRIIDDYEA